MRHKFSIDLKHLKNLVKVLSKTLKIAFQRILFLPIIQAFSVVEFWWITVNSFSRRLFSREINTLRDDVKNSVLTLIIHVLLRNAVHIVGDNEYVCDYRGVFPSQSNIQDGAFSENS